MKTFLALIPLLFIGLSACTETETEPATAADVVDVCEQAALHREECVGDYVTPPECDASAEFARTRASKYTV